MLVRNTYKLISLFTISLFVSFSVHGQDAPPGNLIVVTPCTINDGNTVADVIAEARNNNIGDGGPNLIFYRYPVASNGAPSNRLMRVVYWSNMEHWATSGGAGGDTRLSRMLTCENTNRTFHNNWNVGSGGNAYNGGENDSSLVAARFCTVAAGVTVQQFIAELTNYAEMYRDEGDATLMQLSQRFLGPRPDAEMGTAFTIRTVGTDAAGLARRFDMTVPGIGAPDGPFEITCGDASLFRSYVTHWGL